MSDTTGMYSGNNILSEKVTRALEVRTDTPAMKAALDALGHLDDHAQMDARSVRVAMEQDALQQALLLQEELRRLVDTVQALREGVQKTASIAGRVSSAIQTNVVRLPSSTGGDGAEAVNAPPLGPEDALQKEEQLAAILNEAFVMQREAAQRAETVAAFLEKFDLSEQDSVLLETYAFDDLAMETGEYSEQGMAFLDALERVGSIRKELAGNFSGSGDAVQAEDPSAKLGATSAIRMMESLSSKQERAYERLYHWLQQYLHLNSTTHVPTSSTQTGATMDLIDGDVLDEALSHPLVKRSLHVLRYVPAFYNHLVELIASSRRGEETRRFLLALTAGYGGQSPIELKAHDPVNYVGDMLAFCFQSCSVEADVIRGLVVAPSSEGGGDAQGDAKDSIYEESEAISGGMSAVDMLSHAMSGLARPLKSRILQVAASLARRADEDDDDDDDRNLDDDDDEDAIARARVANLYSICGLLLFYRSAIHRAVSKLDEDKSASASNKTNPLISVIEECLQETTQAYGASVKVYSAMLENLTLISGDSEASLVHSMMQQITNVRMASPGFASDVVSPKAMQKTLSMEFVSETLLEAALALCKTLDDAVTLKMSLAMGKKADLQLALVTELENKISQKEQTLVEDLVETETNEVLEICGLSPILHSWRNVPNVEGMTMETQPGLGPDDMESAMKEFYASLYSPPIPAFEHIQDPILRKLARSKIASNVVNVYQDLYTAISSERGGYDDLSFLGHTPSQVKTLFSA